MPFTLAHPAVVLPFIRQRNLSATALVVGSLTPDFEYFLKMAEDDVHSHTIAGIFYFNLPLVFLLSIVFHLLVKPNFIDNLPAWLQMRFNDVRKVEILSVIRTRPWSFTLSALLGAASHLVWDNFTHADGFFVTTLWFYEGSFVRYNGATYPLWYALQHFSTYIGMFVVLLFILHRRPQSDMTPVKVSASYWLVAVTVVVVVMYVRVITSTGMTIGDTVVSVISSLCIALVACGCLPFQNRVVET